MTEEETRYVIALTRQHGIGPTAALQLYKHYGSAKAIHDYRHETPPKVCAALANWDESLRRADVEIEFCEKNNIHILSLADEDYPARLRECPDPPLTLFYRGTANLNVAHIVAVVGTRHITEYGKDICKHFCHELIERIPDCVIVSGLAYGVDINAHRACLEAGGQTVAVLAHGLDRIYPPLHRDTAKRMLESGGLITEYVTGTVPDKGNFVRRNRIVAGLSQAVIIVESADRGGALITARLAFEYDREVFTFPGRINDHFSAGCNALIRDNKAALITSATDLVTALNWQSMKGKPVAVQRELFPEMDDVQRSICQALQGSEGVALNRLAINLNIPVQQLSTALFDLEMTGVVRLMPGGRYRLIL